jgi:secreted Zn-dependent insulinase-like peptidase
MHPANSSFRIDLLTKSYAAIKQQLQQAAADPSSWLSNSSSSSSCGVQDFTEPWFKMDALSVKLPESLTGGWADSAVADDLALPPPNPYIPSDFELKTDGSAAAADSKQLLAAVEPWMLVGGAAAQPDMLLAAPPAMLLDEPGE